MKGFPLNQKFALPDQLAGPHLKSARQILPNPPVLLRHLSQNCQSRIDDKDQNHKDILSLDFIEF